MAFTPLKKGTQVKQVCDVPKMKVKEAQIHDGEIRYLCEWAGTDGMHERWFNDEQVEVVK